jgi:ATP phosphoribosyltransferase regulatory subunit HisZ
MEDQQCCQMAIGTLRGELHGLIARCTLPEVLDRLTELVNEQQSLDRYPELKDQWNELVRHLEQATIAALVLVNLEDDLWS